MTTLIIIVTISLYWKLGICANSWLCNYVIFPRFPLFALRPKKQEMCLQRFFKSFWPCQSFGLILKILSVRTMKYAAEIIFFVSPNEILPVKSFGLTLFDITGVCETRMPPAATKSKYGKNLYVQHFDLTPPQGACDVSEVWGTHRWSYSPSLVTESSPKL